MSTEDIRFDGESLMCPDDSPFESYEFIYHGYASPVRRSTRLEGRDIRCGTIVSEFAAHLVACGYSPSLVEKYIPNWRSLD